MSSTTYYSTNDENYCHTDIHDVIQEAADCPDIKVGDKVSFWEGESKILKASDFFYGNNVIENMSEMAYENCGEYAEGWPEIKPEQNKLLITALEKVIDQWATNHDLHPMFGSIENTKKRTATITQVEPELEYTL